MFFRVLLGLLFLLESLVVSSLIGLFFIVDQTKFYFDSTSSTPRTLEYVTIDRGNGNSNTRQEEEEEQFVTPLPELFDLPFEDEDEVQKDDERPRSGLQNVRELE